MIKFRKDNSRPLALYVTIMKLKLARAKKQFTVKPAPKNVTQIPSLIVKIKYDCYFSRMWSVFLGTTCNTGYCVTYLLNQVALDVRLFYIIYRFDTFNAYGLRART